MKETPVAQRVVLAAGETNVFVQRNNVGACYDDTGRMIRYGLINETPAMNTEYKSSDFIGILPRLITPDMVGYMIGQYLAVETKATGWHLTPGDKRGQAQLRYHELVRRYGGIAGFVTSDDDFRKLVGK
jgi:hypothetical protein